ncbi:hypothetical protein D3C71_1784170 [compost metagenome]
MLTMDSWLISSTASLTSENAPSTDFQPMAKAFWRCASWLCSRRKYWAKSPVCRRELALASMVERWKPMDACSTGLDSTISEMICAMRCLSMKSA